MKHRQFSLRILAGVLAAVSITAAAVPTLADTLAKNITAYTGVKVYVDDVPIDAGNTHGNPEAFIYNGTTYVAVAAVSNSLNEAVKWEDSTKSVYIGKHMNEGQSLLKVCPPYEADMFYETPEIMTVAGKKYTNGFILGGWSGPRHAYYNLDGKYDTLSFDVGHVDGSSTEARVLDIILDDQVVESIKLTGDMMLEHHEITVTGAKQMKLILGDGGWHPKYGFVNAELR